MNKYFLLSFALILLALDVGLRVGKWANPPKTQVKVVKVKAKAPPPVVKVVKVEVPAEPVACIEPVARTVAAIPKPKKTRRPARINPPAPVVPTTPQSPETHMAQAPVAASIPENITVESEVPARPLVAPVIKSIQTEE